MNHPMPPTLLYSKYLILWFILNWNLFYFAFVCSLNTWFRDLFSICWMRVAAFVLFFVCFWPKRIRYDVVIRKVQTSSIQIAKEGTLQCRCRSVTEAEAKKILPLNTAADLRLVEVPCSALRQRIEKLARISD